MKATVTKAFYDCVNGVALNVGDPFSCDDKRVNFLLANGYIKAEEDVAEKPKKKTTRKKAEV